MKRWSLNASSEGQQMPSRGARWNRVGPPLASVSLGLLATGMPGEAWERKRGGSRRGRAEASASPDLASRWVLQLLPSQQSLDIATVSNPVLQVGDQ